ncbi:MAG: hypothetical protein LLF98_01815 [Clostridium sp.]|uniref:hypothetical protein n=1 Tax=Clostridium sp. TaxID=1506 RepID=UPI0025B92165|nr:hypothetical protein [Clostridium sp.]MCE5220017.1 hypothetical protein [Clostridium sp.]
MDSLFEILEEHYKSDEIIEMLRDFDRDDLEEYAISHNTCIRCGGDLLIHRWLEDKGEYCGDKTYKEMKVFVCENCQAEFV